MPNIVKVLEEIVPGLPLKTNILFVDDGSHDSTWNTIGSFKKTSPIPVDGIRLSRNFGKDMAILAALRATKTDHVIVMDVDGQHPPTLIPEMISLMEETGADIINGVKTPQENASIIYRGAAGLFNKAMSFILGTDFYGASDFKLLNRRAIDALCNCGDKNFFFRGLSHWIGFKQESVTFTVPEVDDRSSRWTNLRLFRYAIDGIVLFSYSPLYVIVVLGIVALVLTSVLMVALFIALATGSAPPGYATLLTVCLLNLSFSMLGTGCLGMYVKNILDQAKDRPHYFISEEL